MMDLPEALELQFRNRLKQIEEENGMPYVTSVERLARVEGRAEGKIQLLQELLGLPVMTDADLEQLDASQLEALLTELRKRIDAR